MDGWRLDQGNCLEVKRPISFYRPQSSSLVVVFSPTNIMYMTRFSVSPNSSGRRRSFDLFHQESQNGMDSSSRSCEGGREREGLGVGGWLVYQKMLIDSVQRED